MTNKDLNKVKTRNWALLVYPDSAPENWEEILKGLLVPVAISPLHSPDEEAGKKPHYHIFLKFDSNKSYKQICEIAEELKAPLPRPVNSAGAFVRYLIHKDHPEKEQFKDGFDSITAYNGFDVAMYAKMTVNEYNGNVADILRIIRDYGLYDFGELVDFLLDNELFELFGISHEKSYFINSYIKSKRYKLIKDTNDYLKDKGGKL